MTIGIALVGCGVISHTHADAIARTDAQVVALIDVDAAAATEVADWIEDHGRPHPATFSSLTDALAAGGIDVVTILVPSGLHVSLATEAIDAGVHVVIEKPLDVSLPRARQIAALADAAEAKGLVVTVISQHRFDPASVVVHDAIARGDFGRLTSGIASTAWWRSQEYYDQAGWRGTWRLDGGGAAMNQGVHTIDLLLWMLGRPVAVSAQTAALAHERIEVEDTLVATVTFASGALGLIHATTAAFPGVGTRLQVHGSGGSAIIEEDQLLYFATDEEHGNRAGELVEPDQLRGNPAGDDAFIRGHHRQYVDILDAIQDGRAPGVRVADAMLALAVIRALYLSSTLGRTVTIAEVLDGSLDDVEVRTGGAP